MPAKHTEGPWHLNGPWHIEAPRLIRDPTGARVVALITPCRGADHTERMANARLIEAAPELKRLLARMLEPFPADAAAEAIALLNMLEA